VGTPLRRHTAVTALGLVGLCVAVYPHATEAQGRWYVTPSLTLAEEYESNIFGTPSPTTSDFVTRFTPGFVGGYESEAFTLLASYYLSAEVYAEHSELNDAVAQQAGGLTLRYQPERRITLGLSGSYTETNNAGQFLLPLGVGQGPPATQPGPTIATGAPQPPTAAPAPGAQTTGGAGVPGAPVVTGINVGRQSASAISLTPSLGYQLDAQTSLDGTYSYTRTHVSGGSTDEVNETRLAVSRQLTPRDRGTLEYRFSLFESDQTSSTTAHAVLVGWTRQLTEALSARLAVGPRFQSTGGTDVDADASLQYILRETVWSLAYSRTEGLVIGRTGGANIDAVVGTVRYQPLSPLVLRLIGSVTHTSGGQQPAETVYAASVSASYQLTTWLAARIAYQFSHDAQQATSIDDHVANVSLDFSYPIRLR
jgi:hypothetical protein